MGADDYIAKPFSQRLLIARIRAILRRQELERGEAAADQRRARAAALERGRLVMDPARHKVRWDGRDVSLTVTEFLILEALAQRPGVVKTRNQLLDVAYQRRCLCRRPHDRQPHQAHPAQVPRASTPNSMRSRPSMASDTDFDEQ